MLVCPSGNKKAQRKHKYQISYWRNRKWEKERAFLKTIMADALSFSNPLITKFTQNFMNIKMFNLLQLWTCSKYNITFIIPQPSPSLEIFPVFGFLLDGSKEKRGRGEEKKEKWEKYNMIKWWLLNADVFYLPCWCVKSFHVSMEISSKMRSFSICLSLPGKNSQKKYLQHNYFPCHKMKMFSYFFLQTLHTLYN